jgi:hypothetical protein
LRRLPEKGKNGHQAGEVYGVASVYELMISEWYLVNSE